MNWTTKKKVAAAGGGGVITAAAVSAMVFLGMASPQGVAWTAEKEQTVLANYIDSTGTETWCAGQTKIGYRPDGDYSEEYCEALDKASYEQYSGGQYRCYTEEMKPYITVGMHIAFTDLRYNAGANCKSNMMQSLKRGEPRQACEDIKKYDRARVIIRGGPEDMADGKRDGRMSCSLTKGMRNGCYGVWARRLEVIQRFCLEEMDALEAQIAENENVQH